MATKLVASMAFSPDGKILTAGGYDGYVKLWDVSDPARPRQVGQLITGNGSENSVTSVAFSPDGKSLATGGYDFGIRAGAVMLWDVSDPARPGQVGHLTVGNGNGVHSVAFSPDGATLAVGDADGAVTLWNVDNPAQPSQLGQPLTVGNSDSNYAYSVAFSPDGKTLAAGEWGSGAQIWQNASYAISRICPVPAAGLTPQQWRQYIPQLQYDPPCSSYR